MIFVHSGPPPALSRLHFDVHARPNTLRGRFFDHCLAPMVGSNIMNTTMDPLEPRQLLSAVLKGHLLKIIGSNATDVIRIRAKNASLVVVINGAASKFPFDSIDHIRIHAGAGNDVVRFASHSMFRQTGIVQVPGDKKCWPCFAPVYHVISAEIDGGAGDDIISATSINDSVHGGTGNDRISTAGTYSHLFGDDGDDTILGGNGEDHISGGNGNDVLRGRFGMDTIFGDAGDDDLSGGPDDDTVVGGPGDDLAHSHHSGHSRSFTLMRL